MTLALERYRIRLACNGLSHSPIQCTIQESAPSTWRGTHWQIEIALYWGATLIDDVSNLTSVHLDITPNSDRDATPLIQKSVLLAAFTKADLTAEEWVAGAAANCHAIFELTAAETQFDMSDASQQKITLWAAIHGVTSAGKYVPYGGTTIEVEEDGAQNGLAVAGGTAAVRVSDGELQLYDTGLAQWRTVMIANGALALGPGES